MNSNINTTLGPGAIHNGKQNANYDNRIGYILGLYYGDHREENGNYCNIMFKGYLALFNYEGSGRACNKHQ